MRSKRPKTIQDLALCSSRFVQIVTRLGYYLCTYYLVFFGKSRALTNVCCPEDLLEENTQPIGEDLDDGGEDDGDSQYSRKPKKAKS